MIIPEGQEALKASAPLEVSKAKDTAMVKKAKELLTKPMGAQELMSLLEQYYVYGQVGKNKLVEGHKSEHYTSAQLKAIVMKVESDLKPVVEVEEVEMPQVIK